MASPASTLIRLLPGVTSRRLCPVTRPAPVSCAGICPARRDRPLRSHRDRSLPPPRAEEIFPAIGGEFHAGAARRQVRRECRPGGQGRGGGVRCVRSYFENG